MKQFMNELSSKAPVPGGGGACAYTAALGMALGTMVANLTTGKKKYALYQEEIEKIIEDTTKISEELYEYIKKDAESFEPLSKAYGLPKETQEQIQYKDKVMEEALLRASKTPLELMEKIMEALKILERLSKIGSKIAISDIGAGAQLCKAALNGASLNVFINTKLMKNREIAEELILKTDELLIDGNELAENVYNNVLDEIR